MGRHGRGMIYAGVFAAFAALVAAVCWSTWAPGTPTWALLLWPSLVALAGAAAGRRPGLALLDGLRTRGEQWDGRTLMWVALGVFVALCGVARLALDAFPNSGDEYAYLLQAETYARGRLWVEAPAYPDLFIQIRFVAKDGIWVSAYQPGWALLLTPAVLAGVPTWLVSPMIGAAMTAVFFTLARAEMGRPYAWAAVIALITSAFFVLNLGSYFSHGAGALAALLFALCGHRYLTTGRVRWALLAGASLGYLGFIRAFNAPLIGLSLVIVLAMTRERRGGLIWLGLAGVPFLAALLAYNAAVTGDPFLQVQEWVSRRGEPIGGPSLRSLMETGRRLARLSLWTSPVFLPAWAAAFAGLAWRRRLSFIDWVFPVTVLGFLLYAGSGGNQYGPRYLFEGWPFALITCAKALELLVGARPRAAAWAASLLGVHLAFQSGYVSARLFLEHQAIIERQDVYRQVRQTVRDPAVVIISGHVGRLDPMADFDLSRNGLEVGAEPVVYAIDPTLRDPRLHAMFPDRRFYVYRKGRLEALP